jgi:outer membrane lipoprotein-sorting protein
MRHKTAAYFLIFCSVFLIPYSLLSQDAMAFVQKVKAKIDAVNDYSAVGKLKTDVVFLKVPDAMVNVFFKKPNKFQISKEKGISILPKGGMNMNMQNLLASKDFLALDAGATTVAGTSVKIIKLLPSNESSDVVLTTLYVDPTNFLIRKTTITTKQNGTYDVEMTYGKYAAYALPDKVVLSFNTKEYKLPKGVTLEFDDGERANTDKLKNSKGTVEITYQSYKINKGVSDDVFK